MQVLESDLCVLYVEAICMLSSISDTGYCCKSNVTILIVLII